MRAVLLPEFPNAVSLPPQASPRFGKTSLPQEAVQLFEGVYLRHRDQEVAAGVSHQVLHQSLLMGLAGVAEAALEQIVAPEGDEGLLLLGLMSRQCSPHRLRELVIPDSVGHAPEEGEGFFMPFEEGLLLLIGEGHQERDLGVAQAARQELDRKWAALHHHQSLAEVELSVLAGLVGKRDEKRTPSGAVLPHVLPDGGLAAAVAMLPHQPLVDATAGVTLLRRAGFVLGQPLVYDGDERAEDRPGPRLAQRVAGRAGITKSLADCPPVMMPFSGDAANALALDEVSPADLLYPVHFQHPFPPVAGFPSSLPESQFRRVGFPPSHTFRGGCLLCYHSQLWRSWASCLLWRRPFAS